MKNVTYPFQLSSLILQSQSLLSVFFHKYLIHKYIYIYISLLKTNRGRLYILSCALILMLNIFPYWDIYIFCILFIVVFKCTIIYLTSYLLIDIYYYYK